jgi:hypothetical protein
VLDPAPHIPAPQQAKAVEPMVSQPVAGGPAHRSPAPQKVAEDVEPASAPAAVEAQVVKPMVAAPVADVALYSRPARTELVTPDDLSRGERSSRTMARKVAGLARDIEEIDAKTRKAAIYLAALERENDTSARAYYAHVATILAQLQAGTTPGNPRLVSELGAAEGELERLSDMLSDYGKVSRAAGDLGARALSLSQEVEAALTLPGSMEEDHRALSALQDSLARSMVSIDRVGRTVTEDVTRAGRYARAEQVNLRLLALAVERGELYGIGPAGVLSAPAPVLGAAVAPDLAPTAVPASEWQPLLKVTFDKPDVAYEAPLHAAVRDALGRVPAARFALVSVYPAPAWEGQKATAPVQAAALDRRARDMRDVLTRMGLAPERVALSSRWGKAPVGEVYLYLVP